MSWVMAAWAEWLGVASERYERLVREIAEVVTVGGGECQRAESLREVIGIHFAA